MSKHLDSLLASMKTLRLKDAERVDTRALLEARIRFPHAFRVLDSAAEHSVLLPSEKMFARVHITEMMHELKEAPGFWSLRLFSFRRFIAALSAVLAMFGTGGGVLAYAAEDALPGDTLYSVKVAINEPAIAFLHRTPQAKARWAGRKLERRLAEAEKLSLRDSITPEIEATLMQRMMHAEEEVERGIIDLPEEKGRQESRERLRHMKERQRNVVGRFREKRMKNREVLLPQEEIRSNDDDDRMKEGRTDRAKLPVFPSGSDEVRKERIFSSSAEKEKFREIIRSPEESSTEVKDSVPEDPAMELRKGSKEKLNRKKSL